MKLELSEEQIEDIIELREVYLLQWSEIARRVNLKAQFCSHTYERARGKESHQYYKSKVMRRVKAERSESQREEPMFEGANWVPQLKLIRGASYVQCR